MKFKIKGLREIVGVSFGVEVALHKDSAFRLGLEFVKPSVWHRDFCECGGFGML
jgi:hypothetical protein